MNEEYHAAEMPDAQRAIEDSSTKPSAATARTNSELRSALGSLTFLPIFGQLTVLVLAALLVGIVGARQPSSKLLAEPTSRPAIASSLTDVADDFAARSAWVLACVALLVGMVLTTAFARWVILQRQRALLGVTWGAGFALVVVALLFSINDSRHGAVVSWSVLDRVHLNVGTHLGLLFHCLDAAGAIPIVFATIAMEVLISRRAEGAAQANAGDAEERFNELNALLYCVAITCIIAVSEIRALYNWLAITWPEQAVAIRTLGQSTAYFVGGITSVGFLATYVPAVAVLRRDIRGLARDAGDRRERMRVRKLLHRTNVLQRVLPAMSVIAPFLVGGPLADLLEKLLSKHSGR